MSPIYGSNKMSIPIAQLRGFMEFPEFQSKMLREGGGQVGELLGVRALDNSLHFFPPHLRGNFFFSCFPALSQQDPEPALNSPTERAPLGLIGITTTACDGERAL